MAKLVIIQGDEQGREIALGGRVVLGREGEHAIADTKMSRQHCRVFGEDGQWVVADLNSRNGTLVNGERVSRHTLQSGDRLRVGNHVLQFEEDRPVATEPAATAAPSPSARPSPARPTQPAPTGPARTPRETAPHQAPSRQASPKVASPKVAARPNAPTPAKPAAASSLGAGQIVFTDGADRTGGLLGEDLGQRNFGYQVVMVVAALAAAAALFWVVSLVSEQVF